MDEKMGILGRKLGMTRIFAGDGSAVAVTVVQAGPCPVTQVKTAETDGYNALQIAFEEAKEKHVTKPMKGHFAKAGTALYRKVREIRLDGPAAYEVGAVLTADVFAATVVKRCIVPVVPSVTTPSPVTCSRAGRWRATGVPNR